MDPNLMWLMRFMWLMSLIHAIAPGLSWSGPVILRLAVEAGHLSESGHRPYLGDWGVDGIGFPAIPDSICLFADPYELVGKNALPLCSASVAKLAILELILAAQMILRQHLGVGSEVFRSDRATRRAIEDPR